MIDFYNQGLLLAPFWHSSLQKLKKDIQCQDEALFGALIALVAIQLNVQPLFYQLLQEAGQKEAKASNTSLHNILSNNSQWLCLVIPCGEEAAVLQVQAPGLSQDRKLTQRMTEAPFIQFMKTLDKDGFCLPYQKGIDLLFDLGHSFNNTEPIHLPFTNWPNIKANWAYFREAALSLKEPLQPIITAYAREDEGQESESAFNNLAAGLWEGLQKDQVLSCGQKKKSFFGFFKKGVRQDHFLGQAAFYGDHQEFWDFAKAQWAKEDNYDN